MVEIISQALKGELKVVREVITNKQFGSTVTYHSLMIGEYEIQCTDGNDAMARFNIVLLANKGRG